MRVMWTLVRLVQTQATIPRERADAYLLGLDASFGSGTRNWVLCNTSKRPRTTSSGKPSQRSHPGTAAVICLRPQQRYLNNRAACPACTAPKTDAYIRNWQVFKSLDPHRPLLLRSQWHILPLTPHRAPLQVHQRRTESAAEVVTEDIRTHF